MSQKGARSAKEARMRLNRLRKQRAIILEQMTALEGIIHGSWLERYSTCARKNCSCHRGNKHGPRCYVVIWEARKQRQKYVPASQIEPARSGINQYQRLMGLVDELTAINIQLMRQEELP